MCPPTISSVTRGSAAGKATQGHLWPVIYSLAFAFLINVASVAGEIGTRLVSGESVDSATGYVYVYQGYFPGATPQLVTDWAFFNSQPSNQNWVTPLVLVKKSANQWEIVGIGTSRQNQGTGAQHYAFDLQAGSNVIQNSNYTFGWWNGKYRGSSNNGVIEFSRVESEPGFAESCQTPGCGNGGNIPPEVGLNLVFANDYRGPNPRGYFNSGYGRLYSVAFFTSNSVHVPITAERAPPERAADVAERAALSSTGPSNNQTDLPPTGSQPWVVNGDGKTVPLYKSSYALLISESKYPGGASRWPPLVHTVEEMDRLAAVLRVQGFRVRRVSDLKSAQLESVIRTFIGDFGWEEDSRILIYFSGHGYTIPGTEYSYVVPIDAPDPTNKGAFFAKATSLASFDTIARQFPAKHALFIFDSCFSGGIFMNRAGEPRPPAASLPKKDRATFFLSAGQKPVRQFIAAGGPDQTLPGKSTFLDLMLDILQGSLDKTADGYITGRELGEWLEQNLPSYVPKYAPQNPHSDLIRDPNFILGDMVFQVSSSSN